MNRSRFLTRVIAHGTQKAESLSKVPLVELAGQTRVLVENHIGVLGYSQNEVQIKVSYGKVVVSGSNLCFAQINRDQIVITGQIEHLQLIRR